MKKINRKINASLQIFLLVSMSFAVAFLFESAFVDAQVGQSTISQGALNALKTSSTQAPAGMPHGALGFLHGEAFGGGIPGALTAGLAWGAIVGGIGYGIAKLFGLNNQQAGSIGIGLGAGTFVGTTIYHSVAQGSISGISATSAPLVGFGIGAVVAVGIIVATYKKEKKELVVFECLPWEAPLGGSKCEECNNDPKMPCSEYRCKSLGQACEIVNKGTESELCVWVNREDTQAPKIVPSEDALSDGLEYRPDRAISPPNTGFKILSSEEGCLEPYSNFEFGIETIDGRTNQPEPSQCRADFALKNSFNEMQFLFGGSNLFKQEHNMLLKVPSPFTEEEGENPVIHSNGEYTLYVRCIDANGNGERSAAVAFSFCVQEGPDTTAPEINGFSIPDGTPVTANIDEVPIEIYTNEPAECKWSRQDKSFEAMENAMSCPTQSFQVNAQLNYPCVGKLTAIEDRQINEFFFRCRDHSTAVGGRNTMAQSERLTLRGTEELTLDSVGPSGEFLGGTTTVEVTLTAKTSNGANEGRATCFISETGEIDSYFEMFNTDNFEHNMTLDLVGGNYTYYFRCLDEGGNAAERSTSFSVKVDAAAPQITRAFRDGDNLKVITSEASNCVYSLTTCNYNFEQATQDTSFSVEDITRRTVHFTPWEEDKTYYIKCEDLQGNRPRAGSCQIVVEASAI